ncbi:leucine-rich repeat-containing protein 49 isoform X2 [Trichomycterus rosablanca]|uniref:leucine-rich repeat-containing protein 49 isoform X2 n=1 Tax=Trichomycterus rosablanca TaxID=2290929 RepID=UPI002F351337
MRSQKQQRNKTAGHLLTPMVNSYKLHLAAVKSLVPDKVIPTPLDIRLPKELWKGNNDAHRSNPARKDSRLTTYCRILPTPVLAIENKLMRPECAPLHPPATVMGDLRSQKHRRKAKRIIHSTGAHFLHTSVLHTVGDAAALNERSAPGFLSAPGFCRREDCSASLERLDLDRRGLMEWPDLDGMDTLRFFSLQHNLISHLPNLTHLHYLVFLDLHDNRLLDMTAVSCLRSLRVLMLGRNRIERICGLYDLTKLDVLDLHSNQISRIENVAHLVELRALNLAGNFITRVENLQGLDSLIELDLQHNRICTVTEVDRLPRLQRLFLSGNSISSLDELLCLGDSGSLSELTLDGNPVVEESCYRPTTLRSVLPLRPLDMKRITEEDRRTGGLLVKREDEKKRESHKQPTHKEKRRLAIRNAAQLWEESRSFLELPTQNGSREDVSPENSPAYSPGQINGLAQEPSPDELKRDRISPVTVPDRPAGGSDGRLQLRSTSRPNSPRDPRLQEAGGASVQSLSLSESHVAELDGETVRLFGPGALDTLERGWGVQTASAVTTMAFRYIQFDSIVPTLPRIRLKFPNLTHLMFMETNITRLLQLASLAQMKRLEQVTIDPEGNPVVSLTLWRSFLIYRLNHLNLQKINGIEDRGNNNTVRRDKSFVGKSRRAISQGLRQRVPEFRSNSTKRSDVHQGQFSQKRSEKPTTGGP